MSVFDTALDTLFRDNSLAEDAVFTPAAGSAVDVRAVITRSQVDSFSLGRAGLRLSPSDQAVSIVADIRRSDVAVPKKGDSLTVGALTYPVREIPVLDAQSLTWRLTLGEPS
jgi:hypothetical protein